MEVSARSDGYQSCFDFENNVRIWDPPPPEDENDDVGGSGVDFFSNSSARDAFPIREKPNDPNKEHFGNAVRRHFTALVLQSLKDEKIEVGNESGKESWLETVSFLAWQAARFVKPDTKKGGSMDPRHYVKVKCVTTGTPCESTFIKGIVCTKNVKHKRMVSQHKNPKILILGGALEEQSVSNKLASINTVMEKESDHSKMAVAKIEAHRPNVLLVEKSASSYAQEYLLAKEISLVLNVKRSILERISLCTGAQLVPSIDYIASAQLGQCEVFRVEKVVEECALGIQPSKRSVKTLMYFEGCPRRLGCTVILRGACLEELKKVKRVISLAIFAAYHLSLETSFLADEGATLPKLSIKDLRSISENVMNADVAKHSIASEHSERNDNLEVPDEYFSTADSQSILVSLSSTCIPEGTVCKRSHFFRIIFYGSFDKPLGRYLHEDLFDQTSTCSSCKELHIRCYTHQQGSLTIRVKQLTSMKLSGEKDRRIWMWHRCLRCEPKDGIPPATHRVVLSDATWRLSFGKFLELSFSNHATANRLASCGHSLQKDCLRFYGFGSMVAFFHDSHVDIFSVCLPPLVLDFSYHTMQEWLSGEANLILSSLDSLHLEVSNTLEQIELKISRCDSEPIKEIIHKHTLELKDVLQSDRMDYDVLLKPASAENDQISQGILDVLELNLLKRRLLIDSIMWDHQLCVLDSFSDSNSSNARVDTFCFDSALRNRLHEGFIRRSPSSNNNLTFLSGHKPVFISSVSCIANEAARLLIPQRGQIDAVLALYDNEPTSIISYAISSQEHTNFISCKPIHYEINSEDVKLNTGLASSSVSQFQGDDTHPLNHGLDESKQLHGISIADHKNFHFKFSFDDNYSIKDDRVKFSVTCYFAKQFDALRKKCCPNDLDFIRSISRCKKWNAQGGKSNVYFAMSLDERFIIKQVTRTELDSFEIFAPKYFNYLIELINTESPTCLAKVLGIYQVTVKHLKGVKEVKMDLMVMENLLYGRNVSRVYDLKGLLGVRYIADTSGTNKVLMDLNLLESLRTKPIFLCSKAKRKMERAIWNDTAFLESINVMDYSLLVGVDERKKELVIGIIDYMRQYTWDKRLETCVKASGILGVSYTTPTVVSPLEYKKRFRKDMSNYFLTVPHHWSS